MTFHDEEEARELEVKLKNIHDYENMPHYNEDGLRSDRRGR